MRFSPVIPVAIALAATGCALMDSAELEPRVGAKTVVRGQAPLAEGAGYRDGWRPATAGPVYLAPGEADCTTGGVFGPPTPGRSMVGPRMAGAPLRAPPGWAPPSYTPPTSSADAGWLDFLPPEGGPIASDFGVPVQPTVRDRVPNPLSVRTGGGDAAWETLADVVVRYFPLQSERRVRQVAGIVEEGRIETKWQSAATILEPWRRDTVGAFNRWQSTLQTLRRRALVRVAPAAGGYEIGVRIDKQLEDLPRPERESAARRGPGR